jgi:CheY-like chemotaxis protein
VRVLVVEDERKLAQILASALAAEHYEVVVAPTGDHGFARAHAEVFDLVVLDLMLPGRSGLDILRTLRQQHIETPVLILTARDGVEWAVEANGDHISVEAGANGGSVFRVVLPTGPAPTTAHPEHATQRTGGHA